MSNMLTPKTLSRFVKDLIAFVVVFLLVGNIVLFLMANAPVGLRYALSVVMRYPIGLAQGALVASEKEVSSRFGEKFDFIFLGSSHSARAFDVRYFDNNGLNTFNLSSDSQSPLLSYYLYLAMRDSLKCDHYVVEVSPGQFTATSAEAYEKLANAFPELNPYSLDIAIATKSIHSMFFYLMNKYRILPTSVYKTRGGTKYIKGGYIEYPVSQIEVPIAPGGFNLPNKTQLQYFTLLVETMKRDGKSLAVVIVPLSPFDVGANSSYQESIEIIQDVCNSFRVPFIDFNRAVRLPKDAFYDSEHLNSKGTRLFLPTFLDQLKSIGFVKSDSVAVVLP